MPIGIKRETIMNNRPVIFLGPTLPKQEAADILNAVYMPPAAQGDMLAAYQKFRPAIIGIIDGYFECIPSVWHKEILYLMSEGVHVFGSSSMGALRAAELHQFGMIGIGTIFGNYQKGLWEDDDEVAVVHGPASLGYPALSEAMANIRCTLHDAREQGVISNQYHDLLIAAAKNLHYKNRTYTNICNAIPYKNIPFDAGEKLKEWLPNGRRDLKREDALTLLKLIKDFEATSSETKQVHYKFQNTSMWKGLLDSLSPAGTQNTLEGKS